MFGRSTFFGPTVRPGKRKGGGECLLSHTIITCFKTIFYAIAFLRLFRSRDRHFIEINGFPFLTFGFVESFLTWEPGSRFSLPVESAMAFLFAFTADRYINLLAESSMGKPMSHTKRYFVIHFPNKTYYQSIMTFLARQATKGDGRLSPGKSNRRSASVADKDAQCRQTNKWFILAWMISTLFLLPLNV